MESNFDKIKKVMSENTDNQLPPELNWDNMESGILEKMSELQAVQTQDSSGKNRKLLIFSLTLLALILILNGIYFGKKLDVLAQNENLSIEQANEGFKIISINEKEEQLKENSYKNDSVFQITPVAEINYFGNRFETNTHQTNSRPFSNDLQKKDLLKPKANISLLTKRKKKRTNESSSSAPNEKSINSFPSFELRTGENLSFLPSINFSVANQPKQDNVPIPPLSIWNNSTNSYRLSLLGGVSFWNNGYGNTKPQRDEFESNKLSYHAGLNYIHTSKNGFSFMIGIQYQQMESRFDWTGIIPDYQLTLTDTILEISTDAFTGEQTEIRGDVNLSVYAERKIRHFNRTRIFQIPFAVGKAWISKSEKLQLDVLAGGSFNIMSNNAGRTFYQGEIQNYNSSSNNFLSKKMKFNTLLGGRLTYYLNSNLGIMTGFQFQKSISNWSIEQDIKVRPSWVNLSLGLAYYIDKK